MSDERDKMVDDLVNLLGKERVAFCNAIEGSVNSYIASRSLSTCLTVVEKASTGDRSWRPEATWSYLTVLREFCGGKSHRGNGLDSALSAPVVSLVSGQFEVFYEKNADEISKLLSTRLLEDRLFSAALLESIVATVDSEIPAALKGQLAHMLIHKLGDSLHSNLGHATAHAAKVVTAKAVAAAVSVPIAHSTVALVGKFLALHLKVVLAKVLASSAVKAAVAAAVKKVVVAAIIGALVKILGVKLLGLSAGAAFAVVVIPLLIAFLTYEAYTLPKKLGEKVSEKVRSELSGQFDTINRSILSVVVREVVGTGLAALAAEIAAEPEIRAALAGFGTHIAAQPDVAIG